MNRRRFFDFGNIKRRVTQLLKHLPRQFLIISAISDHTPLMERDELSRITPQELCPLATKRLLLGI
ncbi:MAG: hypothetical protein M3347_11705 [Armatimonadota bacterium]|nr:hypothetical protein [Armatimonadota bacterium]